MSSKEIYTISMKCLILMGLQLLGTHFSFSLIVVNFSLYFLT